MENIEEKDELVLAFDVSTTTIGVALILDDKSRYGKIIELTHISPSVPKKIKGIEQLFLKKRIFEEFIQKYKKYNIKSVVIEEPLLRSNNLNTASTLLRFNGIISDCVYNELGIVPVYISSYDARKYCFPELMAVRKYGKDSKEYPYQKIMDEIINSKFVLFGSYSWEVDKKTVIQGKIAELFPYIEWKYDKKGELKKENFDSTDAYIAGLALINKKRYGELEFKTENIVASNTLQENVSPNCIKDKDKAKSKSFPSKIEYDVKYWDRIEHRTTFIG